MNFNKHYCTSLADMHDTLPGDVVPPWTNEWDTLHHLIGQRVHDDAVWHKTQGVHLPHQHVGWDLVELDVLQEVADHVLEWCVGVAITILLAPHQSRLRQYIIHLNITAIALSYVEIYILQKNGAYNIHQWWLVAHLIGWAHQYFNKLINPPQKILIYHHQSILPKGRYFIVNSGTNVAVLPKGRSSTANS